MDLGLKDKVVLVTGGSRGLGRAICLEMAKEGARVAVNYYKADPKEEQRAYQVVDEIQNNMNGQAFAIGGDVSKESDIEAVFAGVIQHFGQVDALVNNAGIWPTAYILDMKKEDWDRTLNINLSGPFMLCQRMFRYLVETGRRGKIVNIVSQAAFHGSTSGHAHYAASKAGLVGFTISLAREAASYGINVNAIAPGMMRTDMSHDALAERYDQYVERIPIGRVAEPEEIAYIAAFLASNKADYITGATIDASGGMLMR